MSGGRLGRLRVGVGLATGLGLAISLLASAATLPGPGTTATIQPAVAEAPPSGSVTGRVFVSPITIGLAVEQRAGRRSGSARALAMVTNHGPGLLTGVVVDLRAVPRVASVKPGERQVIRRLAAGAQGSVAWTICARDPGSYELSASATVGGMTIATPPVVLVVPPAATC